MTTIWDVRNAMLTLADKYGKGYASAPELSNVLDLAQQDYYRECNNQPDTTSRQNHVDALIPFVKSAPLTSSVTGLIAYPSDYSHLLGLYPVDGTNSPTMVMYSELAYALNSVIYPIASYPIYVEMSTGIQVYPNTSKTYNMQYIRKPNTPIIGVTISGTMEAYNSGASVQLDFSNNYWPEIIRRALLYLSINLNAAELASLSAINDKMT